MKDPATGKFVASRTFKSTGEVVRGEGETREEAKKNLRELLEREYKAAYPKDTPPDTLRRLPKYRPKLVPIEGMTIRSPGYVLVTGEDGKVSYVFDPNHRAQVFARPDLAQALGTNIKKAD